MTNIYYEYLSTYRKSTELKQNVLDRLYQANSRIETLEETWDYFSNIYFLYFLE